MKYYLDITLLPNAEIALGFIWQKVYQQIHIALVEHKIGENQSAIAICFPKYAEGKSNNSFPLGDKLRLFSADKEMLNKLAINNWLNRLTDYVHVTSIKDVPLSVNQYVCFSRKQFKSNVERLARRRAKRKSESFEQAMQHYKDFTEERDKCPFINVKSLSKEEPFKLFIGNDFGTEPIKGIFNCYGLSKTATVPWF